MPLHKTDAIVLRSINYGESDRIVTFFTRDFGKLKGIAKGARRSRKRFQNALELFSHVRLNFFERDVGSLVRAEACDLLDPFPRIRDHLKRILYGHYAVEILDAMAGEREGAGEAYPLLLSFLQDLDGMEPREERLRVFEARMLSLCGYRPSIRQCCHCRRDWEALKREPSVFFSLEKGALVCQPCSRSFGRLIPISLGTARLLESLVEMELPKIARLKFTSQSLAETREVLPRFIMYHLGKELKSFKSLSLATPPVP